MLTVELNIVYSPWVDQHCGSTSRRAGHTRTCIHTAGATLEPSELTDEVCERLLDGAALVYFDGRQTESAIGVARAARRVGVPVLVEAERLRPRLEFLLAEADYVVTSSHFPAAWSGEAQLGDAMLATALRFPNIRWMVRAVAAAAAVVAAAFPARARTHAPRRACRFGSALQTSDRVPREPMK